MAAPMSFRKVVSRLNILCRRDGECRRFAKTKTAAKTKKTPKREPMPWEDRPGGLIIMKEHAPFIFKFEDAVNMHKEAAQPAMANNLQGHIYADMLLDFTSTKVTKPMKHYIDCIHFPHKFQIEQDNQFMVFSESEEQLEKAKSFGVNLCGGMEFIEKMVAGQVHRDDIAMTDYVIATPEIYSKMVKLRSILKAKFPKTDASQVGDDIKAMIDHLNTGVRLATHLNTISEIQSRVQVPFGQLQQDIDDLTENFDHLIQFLFNKKKSEKLAPHVQEVILIAPPSTERFVLNMNYITRKPVERQVGYHKQVEIEAEIENDQEDKVEKDGERTVSDVIDSDETTASDVKNEDGDSDNEGTKKTKKK